MMEQSRHPIDVIARQTGFADRDRMRRAFLRTFGQPPQVMRRNARAEAALESQPFVSRHHSLVGKLFDSPCRSLTNAPVPCRAARSAPW